MSIHPIVIVGAGLSGLRTASLLAKAGADFVVLEGRLRTGGQAYSVGTTELGESDEEALTGRYDLGGTWIWRDGQPRIRRLVAELGLETFPQYVEG
jgi:monoamine oxidase